MPVHYDQVMPWGRSYDEYVRMFALRAEDLTGRQAGRGTPGVKRVLGCGDGPASFNAEATQRGCRVVSCDPIYQFTASQIEARIEVTYPIVMEQTRRNRGVFVWDTIASVEELGRVRMTAMRTFLRDYEAGRREGRYVVGELPSLPLADGAFDLALCSHLLFLYSDHLSRETHEASALELCRVAREVRIFPLLDMTGRRSAHVEPVVEVCEAAGHRVTVERVPYEFQRGGNEMLRVRRQ